MSCATWMMERLVIPLRMLSADAGVMILPWRYMKMFSPVHSATCPTEFSMTASLAPWLTASLLARVDAT